MTFEEWYSAITAHKLSDNRKWLAEQAWIDATHQEKQRHANWNDVWASQKIDSLEYQLEIANDMIKMLEKELFK